jgi:hypothetical protein
MSGTRYTEFQAKDTLVNPWLVCDWKDGYGYIVLCKCKDRSSAVKIRAALNFVEAAKRSTNTGSHAILQQQYNELLFAVARKFPNKSRHQTALRYIQQAESNSSKDCGVAKQQAIA